MLKSGTFFHFFLPGAALWLCQNGADVHAMKTDSWNDSVLHYAASQGSMECVQVLLAYGADPTVVNFAGHSPAKVASDAGHDDIAKYLNLLTKEQYPDRTNYYNKYYACLDGKWILKDGAVPAADNPDVLKRGRDGYGTPGTEPSSTVRLFRPLALATQIAGTVYIIWRALRTLRPGLGYTYSIAFYLCEFSAFLLGNCFMLSLWNQIDRPERRIDNMLPLDEFPDVDVYIVCYNEPVEVVEATVIAAINMDFPGGKMTIKVLDDGRSSEIQAMVARIQKQATYMMRNVNLLHCVRDKVKGIPHHAKAGNINSTLLKGAFSSTADFIVVLDCDMIVHPSFLLHTLGHFYEQREERWTKKGLAAFIQTPQDFWNVDAADPMVHCARFFYVWYHYHGVSIQKDFKTLDFYAT